MPEFKKATDKFVRWLTDHGIIISPKVEIADYRACNQGRGLRALEDIDSDEVLFTIPRSVVLNIDNCSLIRDVPDLKQKLLSLNQWEALIICILYELKVKKSSSEWYSYFQVLPILDDENYVFNQLMFWTDSELERLKPSLILDRIGKDLAEAMFAKLYPKIIIHDLQIEELKGITLRDYNRVASIIMSYSFDVDWSGYDSEDKSDSSEEDEEIDDVSKDDKLKQVKKNHQDIDDVNPDFEETTLAQDGYFKSMVPLADTLNADTNKHNANLLYTENDLIMKSIKPISKGEQIFNTYSDHPNSEILRRYGYIENLGSKYDFGEIPIDIIKNYFVEQSGLPSKTIDLIFTVLGKIVEIEREDDEDMVEIVLDSYDCFRTSEVILELIFIIQILTIISSIHKINSMEKLTYDATFQLVSRIFKKCYQLIESKRLTRAFLVNYEKILSIRLGQYPSVASEPFDADAEFSRASFADTVLKSEFKSILSCLDVEKTFTDKSGTYKFIDDEKFIKNIIKKRFTDDSTSEEEKAPAKKLKN